MNIEDIQSLIADDMRRVNQTIQNRLSSDVVLINQLGNYIISGGGKRLRPQVAILAAKSAGYCGGKHIEAAAIIEFIHTATLLHDDVVDDSDLRRGKKTANAAFGNEAAVLVGDFLYSRAFEMMVDIGEMQIMEVLAKTTNIIAEGEVMQLMNVHDPDTTEANYLAVIHAKTAKLFEAATDVGAILAKASPEERSSLQRYGIHLGTAFQLIDDILDYTASADELGKNIGDDLAEGKPTLPVIIALRRSQGAQAKILREAIENGGLDQLDAVMQAIHDTNALFESKQYAIKESELAIQHAASLPQNDHTQALIALARIALERSH